VIEAKVEKDWEARFVMPRKKPLPWRIAFAVIITGALALSVSQMGPMGMCGPGTISGVILLCVGLACLAVGTVMLLLRGLVALKSRLHPG